MQKDKLLFAAENIRNLTTLLEAMYGRLGVGAVYDTMRDFARELEKQAEKVV